ncbi:outer membrane lipoprotein LolB [Rugamonas sp.]|uniref:outer membrane lipoprotein LolB n=1 Tax=Rugamonas sp. TaxID=1926287 RepID=UPI0025F4C468|nr:outer membrane lipoprotein LolB [Rugamonas sp.]
MKKFALKFAAAGAAATLLAACATVADGPRSSAAVAPYRDTINLNGRLNVNYHKDDKPESLTVNFSWRQQADRTDVALMSPLGQTVATVHVTPGEATLTQGGKAPRSAADVDTLSAQLLGWSLPVSGLRDWLQGYATGADGSRFAATPARDSVVTRDGWHLHYVSWQDAAAAVPQPRRIDASRSGGGQVDDMEIRIVIDAPL